MGKLFFLIGASGAGKTTAAKVLEKQNIPNLILFHFDSIGIPSREEMIRDFGSSEEWQKKKTIEWAKKIRDEYLLENNVMLDAQTRPSFIEEACLKSNIKNYKVILFDCSDEARKGRFIKRGNPELANDDMINWGRYLREESVKRGYSIIDTSAMSIDDMAARLKAEIGKLF